MTLSFNPHILVSPILNKLAKDNIEETINFVPLSGGRNNKVFLFNLEGKKYVLKKYFFHPDDKRDRLGHEFSFMNFVWSRDIKVIPRPVDFNPSEYVGVYEYICGVKLDSTDISISHVRQAIEFILAINQKKYHPDAGSLPKASEACFSLRDHLESVEKRISRLNVIKNDLPFSLEVKDFVRDNLLPQWTGIREEVNRKIKMRDISIEKRISVAERCISPSDYGFHNALMTKDGVIKFIDFEYAGWDDPAKLICDFFCQPEVPVSKCYLDLFIENVKKITSDPDSLELRVKILLPAYKIKWCCIMLNDFLPAGNSRRIFAEQETSEDRYRLQFEKVCNYMSDV